MNRILKSTLRASGHFYITKQYHHSIPQILKTNYHVKPVFKNYENIIHLVQKSIIPLGKFKQKPSICDKPCLNIIEKIDKPLQWLPEKIDQITLIEIEDPSSSYVTEKKAIKQNVMNWRRIKREKMNLHQRKKRRKKMKYVWARIRRKRNALKDTLFKNEILAKLKELEKFSAEEYVASKLEKYRQVVWPNRWHGVVLPPDIIKDCHVRRERRREMFEAHYERRRKMAEERGGTLAVDVSKDIKSDVPDNK